MSELPESILLVEYRGFRGKVPLEHVILSCPWHAYGLNRCSIGDVIEQQCFHKLIQRELPAQGVHCQECGSPARYYWMGTRKQGHSRSYIAALPFYAGSACNDSKHITSVEKRAFTRHNPISGPLSMTYASALECGKQLRGIDADIAYACINLLLTWSGYKSHFTPQDAVDFFNGILGQYALSLHEEAPALTSRQELPAPAATPP